MPRAKTATQPLWETASGPEVKPPPREAQAPQVDPFHFLVHIALSVPLANTYNVLGAGAVMAGSDVIPPDGELTDVQADHALQQSQDLSQILFPGDRETTRRFSGCQLVASSPRPRRQTSAVALPIGPRDWRRRWRWGWRG
jgi:hypothetical protein